MQRALLGSLFGMSLVASVDAAAPERAPHRTSFPSVATARATGARPVALARLGVGFVENRGQWDESVRCAASCRGYGVLVGDRQAVVALEGGESVRLLYPSDADSELAGSRPGTISFLRGEGSAQASHFDGLAQKGVARGVDLVWSLDAARARFDVHVAAGGDLAAFELGVAGARGARVREDGSLGLATRGGELRLSRPVAWQPDGDARRPVEARWTVLGAGRVGLDAERVDPRLPLVVDPTLEYAAVIGGTQADELFVGTGPAVAVAADGSAYVAGLTASPDLPVTAGAFRTSLAGSFDAFIAKYAPDGTLVYATYLGGAESGADEVTAIAVDAAGAAYVSGITNATDFPTTAGAFDATYGGGPDDGFVAKIAPSGAALEWSTFLGGTSHDLAQTLAIDPATGAVWVAGRTQSPDYPSTNLVGPDQPGSYFVTKLAPGGGSLLYSTIFGAGSFQPSYGMLLAVDASGAAFVASATDFANVTGTAGVVQPAHSPWSGPDGFVGKIAPAGDRFEWLTYLGGSGAEVPCGLALDSSGRAVVYGTTTAESDFPAAQTSAVQPARPGRGDLYVLRLAQDASAIEWATFLGGTGTELAFRGGLALTAQDEPTVCGLTASADFPAQGGLQPCLHGAMDGFVTRLTADGSALVYSTFLGGSSADLAGSVGVDATGAAVVVGVTDSSDFASTISAGPRGASDLFVARLAPQESASACVGTFNMELAKGKIIDSPRSKRDSFNLSGSMNFNANSRDGTFRIPGDAVTVRIRGGAGSHEQTIASLDPNWTVRRGVVRWKSPRGAKPSFQLRLMPDGSFSMKGKAFDFAAPLANPVRVEMDFGDDSGAAERAWSAKKPGRLLLQ